MKSVSAWWSSVTAREEGKERERWSSNIAFIFAAVGSAVGLGNIWRFPALMYSYGGGPFFIPYLLALFLIGIPVLLLETALGQKYQGGDALCFGKMNWRLRGVGVGSVFCGFMVVCYYNALLGWAVRMFGYACGDAPYRSMAGDEAWGWFVNKVTNLETTDNLAPTTLVGANVGGLIFTWLTVFFALVFGVKWTGRLTYVTMGLPVLLILILVIRAATLDGHEIGIKQYIGTWDDMSVLGAKSDMWSTAVSQIFFSLSVTFGIMTAYGSYNKPNQPAAVNAIVIALANSGFSFVAGFAVFGTLGYMAKKAGLSDLSTMTVKFGGPGLMFGTLPVALSTLGDNWERFLFVVVFILGIDSAFSLVEGVVALLKDLPSFRLFPRPMIVAIVCLYGFLLGLPYCTDAGLILLDTVDFYVNFVMLLVGFFEVASLGYIMGADRQAARIGSRLPLVLFAVTWLGIFAVGGYAGLSTGKKYEGYAILVAVLIMLHGFFITFLTLPKRPESAPTVTVLNAQLCGWKAQLYDLVFGNIDEIAAELQDVVGRLGCIPAYRVTWMWAAWMRIFVAPILILLFVNLALSETAAGDKAFGNYEGYPDGYQWLGYFMAFFTLFVVGFEPVVYAIFPQAYDFFGSLNGRSSADLPSPKYPECVVVANERPSPVPEEATSASC